MIPAAIVLPVPDGPAHCEPLAERELAAEAPIAVDTVAVLHVVADLAQLGHAIGRQNDVVPFMMGRDLSRQHGQPLVRMEPAGILQFTRCDHALVAAAHARKPPCGCRGLTDLAQAQLEACGQARQVDVLIK
jgi:hypothetical protein